MSVFIFPDQALLAAVCHRRHIRRLALFGSTVKGTDRPDSDVDLLVEAGSVTSSWFPAGLILDLEDLLGCRVEVVTERGLNREIRDYVLREAIPL